MNTTDLFSKHLQRLAIPLVPVGAFQSLCACMKCITWMLCSDLQENMPVCWSSDWILDFLFFLEDGFPLGSCTFHCCLAGLLTHRERWPDMVCLKSGKLAIRGRTSTIPSVPSNQTRRKCIIPASHCLALRRQWGGGGYLHTTAQVSFCRWDPRSFPEEEIVRTHWPRGAGPDMGTLHVRDLTGILMLPGTRGPVMPTAAALTGCFDSTLPTFQLQYLLELLFDPFFS